MPKPSILKPGMRRASEALRKSAPKRTSPFETVLRWVEWLFAAMVFAVISSAMFFAFVVGLAYFIRWAAGWTV